MATRKLKITIWKPKIVHVEIKKNGGTNSGHFEAENCPLEANIYHLEADNWPFGSIEKVLFTP